MITVLLAEANPVIRIGIRAALEDSGRFFIVGETDGLRQCIFAHATTPADVVLLGLAGLGECERLALADFRDTYPHANILLYSHARDSANDADFALPGNAGYLSRDCSPAELRIAAATVAHGRPYIGAAFARRLSDEVFCAANLSHIYLTPKEMRVFKMLAVGLDVQAIAAQLGVSAALAGALKSRVLARLPSAKFRRMTRFALRRGFL